MSAGTITTGALAALLNGKLLGPDDLQIAGVNSLSDATREHLTFIVDQVNAARWAASNAGAAVVTTGVDVPGHDSAQRTLIVVADADLAMIAVLERLAVPDELPDPGVHPGAFVHPTAVLGRDVRLGPGVWIGARTRIGDGTSVHANAAIYSDVTIGSNTLVQACAVVRERCVVGSKCILGPNSVVGGDGFGYRAAADGKSVVRVPHLGNAVLEDMVEIGCGTTVDRGKFGATRIGSGSKLDNLCQIGHNVVIGRMCMFAAQVGVAGSTVIGDGVQIGGAVGIAGHLKIGSGVKIAARAAVITDIPSGETWGGYPAQDLRLALREVVAVRKLVDWTKQIRKLIDDAATAK
jgi:UDP-3-O-[3-hydroxymyristoyl] glucosamine N-acyltransferase